MNVLPVSLLVAATLAASAVGAPAQVANFDGRPTGFLTARIGGMPADAWKGTSLATAKRLVSALPAAPGSRALRDLPFVRNWEFTEPFGRRAQAACNYLDGDKAAAAGAVSLGQADGPTGGVAAIVRALRQAGEDHAARLFGIETAMAYGL